MSDVTPYTPRKDCTRLSLKVWGRANDGTPWANSDSFIVSYEAMRRERYFVAERLRELVERPLRDNGITITRSDWDEQPCDCAEAH